MADMSASQGMIIPWQQLSETALLGVIEEFIHREGTDYGVEEVSREVKISQIKRQLENGKIVLVFDPASESTSLLPADAL